MQPLAATPWSLTFAEPVAADVVALVRELLGVPVAHDDRTFLFDSITRLTQIGLTVISSRARSQPGVALCNVAAVIELSNGEHYRATLLGWVRIDL
jgi:hypothetical protein